MEQPQLDKDVQDFMDVYDSKKTSSSDAVNLPFDITLDKNAQPIFDGSVNYKTINTKPEPTALETVTGAIKDVSEFHTIKQFRDDIKYKNPFLEPAPEGWSVKDEIPTLTGLDQKYMGNVLKGTNPQDVRNRYSLMLDRQAEDNDWKDGSTFLKIENCIYRSFFSNSSRYNVNPCFKCPETYWLRIRRNLYVA